MRKNRFVVMQFIVFYKARKSSLWQSCDELRGGMDASQYEDYVLVLLFIKYVSDKYADKPYAPITIPSGAGFAAHIINQLL